MIRKNYATLRNRQDSHMSAGFIASGLAGLDPGRLAADQRGGRLRVKTPATAVRPNGMPRTGALYR